MGCHFQEMFVDGCVGRELRMKRGGEEIVFLDEDGLSGKFGEDFEAGADAIDDGSADENHFHRLGFEFGRAEEDVACDLATIGVAEDGHVHKAERGLRGIFYFGREENRAGAGAEDGATIGGELTDGVVEAFFLKKL